jgi:hypothetical protein
MTTSDTMNDTRHQGQRWLAWAVLVASVIEVIAPVVTANGPGSSPGDGSGSDLLITPVGWAFSIWGVIYTLAIVQAVAVLVVATRGIWTYAAVVAAVLIAAVTVAVCLRSS